MSKEPQAREQADETVLEYVKAATSSSDRARAVLIVMVTASVLVFTVIWNTGGWRASGGWLDSRIELRQAALAYFKQGYDTSGAALSGEELDLHNRAGTFLSKYSYDRTNPDHARILTDDVLNLSKIRSEHIRLIRVPFFGIVFDMNDLGLFAGVTFTVVLLWFRFSLARERRNLGLAFTEAEERGQPRLCYELLSMQQVLTLPPMPGQRFRWVWSTISKLLYIIPLVIYSLQFKTDWDTRQDGRLLSPSNMETLLTGSFVMFGLVLILTVQCVLLQYRIDKAWEDAFAKAYPDEGREREQTAGE